MSRAARFALACFVLSACEREEPATQPIPLAPPSEEAPPPEPSPFVVSPHVRRASPTETPPAPRHSGGGIDRRPPTEREVAAFRENLAREMSERPAEEGEIPCDRWERIAEAGSEASDTARPSRASVREGCRELPRAIQECMDSEYFRAHTEECRREMREIAERAGGERERAGRQMDALRREARGR
jgi:hypothetical protein